MLPYKMANIKSAKKRVKTSEKAAERNKSQKSALNTYIKKFKAEPTQAGLEQVISLIDKASQDNLMHTNKANRLKARYSKLVPAVK